jgi:hypothetical protein
MIGGCIPHPSSVDEYNDSCRAEVQCSDVRTKFIQEVKLRSTRKSRDMVELRPEILGSQTRGCFCCFDQKVPVHVPFPVDSVQASGKIVTNTNPCKLQYYENTSFSRPLFWYRDHRQPMRSILYLHFVIMQQPYPTSFPLHSSTPSQHFQ